MAIIKFECGSRLQLKKPHPCGSDIFFVARSGSDVRIICEKCSRDMTIEREKVEKMIKKVLAR